MSRGGKREKAGRPSSWASGCKFEDTKLIRVPAAIADRLLEIAHRLDANEFFELETKLSVKLETETKSERVSSVSANWVQRPDSKERPPCPVCGSARLKSKGIRGDKQRYVCQTCGKNLSVTLPPSVLDSVT